MKVIKRNRLLFTHSGDGVRGIATRADMIVRAMLLRTAHGIALVTPFQVHPAMSTRDVIRTLRVTLKEGHHARDPHRPAR